MDITNAAPAAGARLMGVSLIRGGKTLIKDLSLTLPPTGITMVLGPNGAGKSLLLRLLHGLEAPSAGTIQWGCHSPDQVRDRQAMVFQNPVLLRRSVAANMDFVLRGQQQDTREALLRRVGLLDHATSPARQLSGGEQQRLALARALATEPEVLFLDEATASLDPASIQLIEDILISVRDAGTKIIFVSHDVGQARRLADDVVFLQGGALAEQTPADTFFTNPQSKAAQAYLEGRLLV
jgi:tungstate transport system ATP-binding protein